MKLLKEALVILGIGAVGVAALVIVFQREPWVSVRERELDWIRGYVEWRAAVEEQSPLPPCAQRLDDAAGAAPSRRTRIARRLAIAACRELGRAPATSEVWDHWATQGSRVIGALIDGLAETAAPKSTPTLAARAAAIAGDKQPTVYCWPDDEWEELQAEFQLLVRDEFWVAGYADPPRAQIHLAPYVCAPLRRFFGTTYAPFGNTESFELAEALVIFAHEAEHLRSPTASEAEVECVALQRVRGLVTAAGRSSAYAEEMAGLAFDAGYPLQAVDYRTSECVDGGPLDLNPDTDLWP